MGTYKLKADTVSQNTNTNGSAWAATAGFTVVTAIQTLDASRDVVTVGAGGGTAILRFNLKYYLDGSASPTEINSLPAGFNVTDAALQVNITNGFVPVAPTQFLLQYGTILQEFNVVGNLTFDAPSNTWFYIFDLQEIPFPSSPSLLLNGMGVKIVDTALTVGSVNFLEISGNYNIESFSITLPTSASPGDEVTLTGTGLDTITQLEVQFGTSKIKIPAGSFITHSATTIVFVMPFGFAGFTGTIYLLADGILLGNITLTSVNNSGIYRIISSQRHDVLYNEARDGTTKNVSIPNPFADTGFIGG